MPNVQSVSFGHIAAFRLRATRLVILSPCVFSSSPLRTDGVKPTNKEAHFFPLPRLTGEIQMNKKQLADALAWRSGMSRVRSNEILSLLFDAEEGILAKELVEGGKVTLPGFGTFVTKQRAERIGTNPSSGERITIPTRNSAYFKPGKTLRGRLEQ